MLPFSPRGDSVKVDATTSTGSVPLSQTAESVRVVNTTSVLAFIALGGAGVQANVSGDDSIPIAPGATEVFGGGNYTHAAAVLSSGTGVVWFTAGAGI